MDHKALRRIIGARLRELRAARGWTQVEVAGRARVGRDFLGRAERGDREPSLFVLNKLASVFEVQPAFLLTPAGEEDSSILGEIASLLKPRPVRELRWFRALVHFHLAHRQPEVRESHVRLPRKPRRDK